MQKPTLDERVATLEVELQEVKARLGSQSADRAWLETFSTFANDPVFDEIVREGTKYRQAKKRLYTR